MTWIKLEESFSDHPKIRKLADSLDISVATACGHMALLWVWTLRYAPDGDLCNYTAEDVCYAARWEGDPEVFIAAVIKHRLVDKLNGNLAIHNWMERAERLKNAQRVRRHRAIKRSLENASNVGQRSNHSNENSSNTPEQLSQGSDHYCNITRYNPRITVTSTPNYCNGGEERRGEEKRGEEIIERRREERRPRVTVARAVAPKLVEMLLSLNKSSLPPPTTPSQSSDIRSVWEHYRAYHPRRSASLKSSSSEYKLIGKRLKEGWTVKDVCTAIDGYHVSPFHTGKNDTGTKYLRLSLILRDPAHVEEGMNFWEARNHPKASNGHHPGSGKEEFSNGDVQI